ncbi:MAG: hypothetical protein ABIP21_06960 [Acidimicrobiia bacterium]
MLCFADQTGGLLPGLLRPGNAGANNAADHLTVLDESASHSNAWSGRTPGLRNRDGPERSGLARKDATHRHAHRRFDP